MNRTKKNRQADISNIEDASKLLQLNMSSKNRQGHKFPNGL